MMKKERTGSPRPLRNACTSRHCQWLIVVMPIEFSSYNALTHHLYNDVASAGRCTSGRDKVPIGFTIRKPSEKIFLSLFFYRNILRAHFFLVFIRILLTVFSSLFLLLLLTPEAILILDLILGSFPRDLTDQKLTWHVMRITLNSRSF